MTEDTNICLCCMTNPRKSQGAKYCESCSEHICNLILQRVNRVDTRYKKVFRTMHDSLLKLSREDPFFPKNLKDMIEREMDSEV